MAPTATRSRMSPAPRHLHDVFTYTESDGRGGTASANLDITLNRAPVATNDIAGLKLGATFVGNVLGNDADPDGDSLTVSGVGGGSVGSWHLRHARAQQRGQLQLRFDQ